MLKYRNLLPACFSICQNHPEYHSVQLFQKNHPYNHKHNYKHNYWFSSLVLQHQKDEIQIGVLVFVIVSALRSSILPYCFIHVLIFRLLFILVTVFAIAVVIVIIFILVLFFFFLSFLFFYIYSFFITVFCLAFALAFVDVFIVPLFEPKGGGSRVAGFGRGRQLKE